jgi:hypothetical protein
MGRSCAGQNGRLPKERAMLFILFPFLFHLFKSQKLVQTSKIYINSQKIWKMQIKFRMNPFENISSVSLTKPTFVQYGIT